MKIELSPINKLDMKLLNSYNCFKKAVNDVTYSKDGKMVVGNYGKYFYIIICLACNLKF